MTFCGNEMQNQIKEMMQETKPTLERVIRMVEMLVDPIRPPKFKHKRVMKESGSMLCQ